jgi:multiple sugar transport system ATP-binding protein
LSSITLQHATKVYPNGFKAVEDVNLEINDGELMVLVGPSGCGKTTLMRMIAGLETASDGKILIGERDVTTAPPKGRDVAMVFQNYALYPHMTIGQNIGFPLRLRRVAKRERGEKVARAAKILGLTSVIDRHPGQLSGGQRQRVAMGRAIVREPAVFLMDEPLSNLDAKLRVEMRAEILRIQRRVNVATVYVTHDQTEAMTMGDRVAVLDGGRLQQCDSPQRLYEEPANMIVAAFIGSPAMNLFKATLSADGHTLQVGSSVLPAGPVLERCSGLRAYAGRELVIGLRAEDLEPTVEEAAPAIVGVVDLVEALGSELLVHFSSDAKRARPALSPSADDDGEELPEAEVSGRDGWVARLPARTPRFITGRWPRGSRPWPLTVAPQAASGCSSMTPSE